MPLPEEAGSYETEKNQCGAQACELKIAYRLMEYTVDEEIWTLCM